METTGPKTSFCTISSVCRAPVTLQTVCVRHEPPGLGADALDAHTRRWAQAINESGAACLTPAVVDGRWMVRVSIGIEATEARHVAELWQAMCTAAAASALAAVPAAPAAGA